MRLPDGSSSVLRQGARLGELPAHVDPELALAFIFSHAYIRLVASIYDIVAEPTRRAILTFLADSEHAVGDIEAALRLPQPTVSKHLRVLRDAGLVEARVDAQRRLYRVRPEPLQQIDTWLVPFRRIWSKHVDSLERYLDKSP